jgi:Protein of unknown function (DUF4232)
MRTGTVVAAALLALAGCTSAAHRPAQVPLVPWDGTVPAQLRPAATAPAPPCQASRLRVVGDGFRFEATISGGTGRVLLRNAGPAACQLTGRPDVQVVGAVPAPPQQQTPLPAQPPSFPSVAPPEDSLRSVPPGGSAALDVDWRNWCVPPTRTQPRPPRAIRLTLPGGSSLDVDYNGVPPCENADAASTLGVHPFQPAPLPGTAAWTSTVLQATIQPLDGSKGKLTGRRGDTVRFAVLVRNPSAAPVGFARCPLVVLMLAPAGRPEAHQLNCAAAGQLPAGGALRFEMRVQIPADAPAGDNGLFWELDPTGSQGPEATSRITVVTG